MGALLRLPVVSAGYCLITPEEVGLVTEISVASLLLQQPETDQENDCSCHSADLRSDHPESRILIVDCEGDIHVFPVLTHVLQTMLRQGLLYESTVDIRRSKLQGIALKATPRGNARADMLRRIGIVQRR